MKCKYLECAKILNTHGVRGSLRAECLCDNAKVFSSLSTVYIKQSLTGKDKNENKEEYIQRKIINCSANKNILLLTIEGVNDLDTAIALKGTLLYADRDDFKLGKGDYFIADLIGLPVFDVDTGEKYGTISDVLNRGASDIYVIKRIQETIVDENVKFDKDKEFMIPAVDEFVIKIDIDKGIFIRPIEGMLE